MLRWAGRCNAFLGSIDQIQQKHMAIKAKLLSVWGTFGLLFLSAAANGADSTVHSIVASPRDFDHQMVRLRGTAVAVRETTSRRGNDYTTFKLQDLTGGDTISVFVWGHPTLSNGDCVSVDGTFEMQHHQDQYVFYNEIEATALTLCTK
jgi:hypothetical protein